MLDDTLKPTGLSLGPVFDPLCVSDFGPAPVEAPTPKRPTICETIDALVNALLVDVYVARPRDIAITENAIQSPSQNGLSTPLDPLCCIKPAALDTAATDVVFGPVHVDTPRPKRRGKQVERLYPLPTSAKTTIEVARQCSFAIGARIFWRPDGVVSRTQPELDAAEILEG